MSPKVAQNDISLLSFKYRLHPLYFKLMHVDMFITAHYSSTFRIEAVMTKIWGAEFRLNFNFQQNFPNSV